MLSLAIVAAVLTAATPLILAAVGETLSERAGVINLSLEGSILLSALAAFAGAKFSGDPWIGLLAGALCGVLCSLGVAIFGLWLGASQVAAGFVLTLFYRDVAYFLGQHLARQPGPQFTPLSWLNDVYLLGPLLGRLSPLTFLALLTAFGGWHWLYRTRAGLRLRAVGESPRAAYARGVNVGLTKLAYLGLGGLLCGLAGAAYSLGVKPGWGNPQGAEGSGWITLAIVIFGGFSPLGASLGALLFSALQVAGIYMQDQQSLFPSQVLQLAPFPVMIAFLFLIGLGRSRRVRRWCSGSPWLTRTFNLLSGEPPAASGRNFKAEDEF